MSADQLTSQVYMAMTCGLAVWHDPWKAAAQPPALMELARSDTNNSGYLSQWGGRRLRTTIQRWVDTVFGSWHYFFVATSSSGSVITSGIKYVF